MSNVCLFFGCLLEPAMTPLKRKAIVDESLAESATTGAMSSRRRLSPAQQYRQLTLADLECRRIGLSHRFFVYTVLLVYMEFH